MFINTQPIESSNRRTSGSLEVHSIFYTIQGEGPFAGWPAVFIRLAGCNLQCPGCDTDYTSKRELLIPRDIADRACALLNREITPTAINQPLVVITGGEPFRQNLQPLVEILLQRGLQVQVETNGLLEIPEYVGYFCLVVCSPKTSKINPKNLDKIDAFKYVINANSVSGEDGLPDSVLGMGAKVYRPDLKMLPCPIYVQPMDSKDDEQNKQNLAAALNSAMKFGYILQLQIHKIIGVE